MDHDPDFHNPLNRRRGEVVMGGISRAMAGGWPTRHEASQRRPDQ